MKAESGTRTAGRWLAALFGVFLLAGCATDQEAGEPGDEQWAQSEGTLNLDQDVDPLEGANRFLFAFNDMLDTLAFQPLAATYRVILPDMVRDSIRSFLRNLRTPVILANDLLQGSWDRAETTLVRFAINTTVGVGGLWDAADEFGYAYHDEDFGQTLGVWGVGPYPYLVVPIIGPSTGRDVAGIIVDSYLDPMSYFVGDEIILGRRALEGIDFRSRNIETIEELRADSIDFYARIRSVYLQRRVDEINNGEPSDEYPSPGLSEEEELEEEKPGEDQLSTFE